MENIVTLYKCSVCEKVILKPEDGLVVHGNIYVADPTTRGGLVGNNFPTEPVEFDRGSALVGGVVKETAFCTGCFLKTCLPKLTFKR